MDKMQILSKKTKWLGFKISKRGIIPSFDKSKAIKDLPISKN